MPRLSSLASIALLVFAAGCSGAEPAASVPGVDAGLADAAADLDAANPDAANPDAAVTDAELADTAATDATAADADLSDGPVADVAVQEDSGLDDATVPGDTGVPADAGLGDTGVASDAAAVADAGGASDAAVSGDSGAAADAAVHADASGSADATSADVGAFADAGADAGSADGGARDGGPLDAGGLCTSSRDCIPGVEVCGALRSNGATIEAHCVPANAGGAPVGGACTADNGCADDRCMTGLSNECSVVCSDAGLDCPAGFACTGYRYDPGATWIYMCSRSCQDNTACAAGGNVCSTAAYERSGAWHVDQVCSIPSGPGALGAVCASGNDCQSGLCLTTSRQNGCTGPGGCDADEACQCANGAAPPCVGGAAAACVSHLCSNVCNDDGDCAAPSQSLTACRGDVRLSLPDGSTVQLSSCVRR